jgi:hypothetical protein
VGALKNDALKGEALVDEFVKDIEGFNGHAAFKEFLFQTELKNGRRFYSLLPRDIQRV